MTTKPINFLLWLMAMGILAAGVVVGVAMMTPGGEVIGWTVAIFCALAVGIVFGAPRSK